MDNNAINATLSAIALLSAVNMGLVDKLGDIIDKEKVILQFIIELEQEIYAQKILYLCRTGKSYD